MNHPCQENYNIQRNSFYTSQRYRKSFEIFKPQTSIPDYFLERKESELSYSFLLPHDDTTYRLFNCSYALKCYTYRKTGHISTNCPNNDSYTIIDDRTEENETTNNETSRKENSKKRRPSLSSPITPNDEQDDDPSRSVPTPQNNEERKTETHIDLETFTLPQADISKHNENNKKKNTEQTTSTKIINSVQQLIKANPKQFPIPFEAIKNFLETSFIDNDPLTHARKIRNDIDFLLHTLNEIYPHLKSKTTEATSSNWSNSSEDLIEESDTTK
ncbi:hypothetical protein HHI36_014997 [Cryptolaemus montrouzieri]|uniref:CCHC-type domain-containing protein n=1 Tax=Cryptolaemus montrouzieri TaxID=559131 RepID=A0ABD2N4M8_9CUCU